MKAEKYIFWIVVIIVLVMLLIAQIKVLNRHAEVSREFIQYSESLEAHLEESKIEADFKYCPYCGNSIDNL